MDGAPSRLQTDWPARETFCKHKKNAAPRRKTPALLLGHAVSSPISYHTKPRSRSKSLLGYIYGGRTMHFRLQHPLFSQTPPHKIVPHCWQRSKKGGGRAIAKTARPPFKAEKRVGRTLAVKRGGRARRKSDYFTTSLRVRRLAVVPMFSTYTPGARPERLIVSSCPVLGASMWRAETSWPAALWSVMSA